ncbi:MAG: hypothetical protein WA824_05170 [Candidatus Sulfotelmatobacter sp.]
MATARVPNTPTPTTRTPNLCSDFDADEGDYVDFQQVPSNCNYQSQNCQITQGTTTWPFTSGPPITLPSPTTIQLKSPLEDGNYKYNVSCCTTENATHTVSVGDGMRSRKQR